MTEAALLETPDSEPLSRADFDLLPLVLKLVEAHQGGVDAAQCAATARELRQRGQRARVGLAPAAVAIDGEARADGEPAEEHGDVAEGDSEPRARRLRPADAREVLPPLVQGALVLGVRHPPRPKRKEVILLIRI